MNYTEMLFNRDERLVNLLNQADSKNLELIEEINKKEDEIDRLNNIIERINSFVDRTIEVIKQQPSGNDEWILERLSGIKYLAELKEEGNK